MFTEKISIKTTIYGFFTCYLWFFYLLFMVFLPAFCGKFPSIPPFYSLFSINIPCDNKKPFKPP